MMSDPPETPDSTPIEAADRLATEMHTLAAEFRVMGQAQARNKKVTRWIVISIVAHVLLTVGIVIVTFVAIHVSHEATSSASAARSLATTNRASQRASCLLSNQTRRDDIVLWTHVLNVAPAATPAQKAEHANILAFVDKTFAPAVCVV